MDTYTASYTSTSYMLAEFTIAFDVDGVDGVSWISLGTSKACRLRDTQCLFPPIW